MKPIAYIRMAILSVQSLKEFHDYHYEYNFIMESLLRSPLIYKGTYITENFSRQKKARHKEVSYHRHWPIYDA